MVKRYIVIYEIGGSVYISDMSFRYINEKVSNENFRHVGLKKICVI